MIDNHRCYLHKHEAKAPTVGGAIEAGWQDNPGSWYDRFTDNIDNKYNDCLICNRLNFITTAYIGLILYKLSIMRDHDKE